MMVIWMRTVSYTHLDVYKRQVIVVIAAAVGLGFATGLFGGASDEIEVPDFRGKTLEEAQEEAEKLGLVIEEGDEVYSADQEEGLITSQTPSAVSYTHLMAYIPI